MSFFKTLIASILGLFIGLFLLLVLFVGIGVIVSSSQDKVSIEPNTVLKIGLNTQIKERGSDNPFQNFGPGNFSPDMTLGLNHILEGIQKAKNDDNIKGIYLPMSGVGGGLATVEEIRDALLDFKETGKFVIAYGEMITQKGYYLASVADAVYLNPQGVVELKGYSAELTFFKEALDRLEIEPIVFYAGNFKSATEPLRYTKMSEYNRLQYRELLNGFYDDYIEKVSAARSIAPQQLELLMDSLMVRDAKSAKQHKIVDDLFYLDQVLDVLREKLGIEADEKIKFVSIKKYKNAKDPNKKKAVKEKIAILYAQGGIVDGEGEESEIGSKRFAKAIRKIRQKDEIKAIVIRINSGGGSALASEVIWRELLLAKEKGLPIIASMGDVAASGGYYIPCIADTILAEENTITGSIGVFGLLADAGDFYQERLGFTFDTVKTAAHSDFPTSLLLNRGMSQFEKDVFQGYVDDIYQVFLDRVAEGRNMQKDAVHEIAQGRVWTGLQAKERGLVDIIGGIDEAIAIAAQKAGLENYRLVDYPRLEDPFEKFFKEAFGEVKRSIIEEELGNQYKYYQRMKQILNMKGIQVRIPFELEVQ